MKLEILGAMGTQCKGCCSTSLLVDNGILLDVGTGAFNLHFEQIDNITDVLITHSHLDHTAMLCFIAESRIDSPQGHGLRVHCQPETAEAIRIGFLNGKIWPDFENIIIHDTALMSFSDFTFFTTMEVRGRRFTPFPVLHTVPTAGFCLHGDNENFVFMADVFDIPDETYAYLNNLPNFRRMTIEVSFPEGKEDIAEASGHLTPLSLEKILARLPQDLEILYCHIKPRYEEEIARQIESRFGGKLRALKDGMVFDI